MQEIYYVQRLARQSIHQIVPIPDGIQIPKKNLRGIDNYDFLVALRTYQDILKQMYHEVRESPESFGMVSLFIDSITKEYYGSLGSVTKNEAKSRKSFFRLPNTLLAIASVGELTADGGLSVDVPTFLSFKNTKSSVTITKPEPILERLTDYGFEFEDMPEDYGVKKTKSFTLYYPDDRNVLVVLKAFSCVGFYENLISADYRYLLSNNDKITYEIEDFVRAVESSIDKKLIRELYHSIMSYQNNITQLNIRCVLEYAGFFGKVRFYVGKSKKEILIIDLERDHTIQVQLRLSHIANYSTRLHKLSSLVRKRLISGRDCCYCGYCKDGSVNFTYQNQEYHKCNIIACGFLFACLKEEDIPSILKLILWELECVSEDCK